MTMARTFAVPTRALSGETAASKARRGGIAQSHSYPTWFLWPAFAILLVFFFLPNLLNFVYAFTNWSAFSNVIQPVGLANFEALIQDDALTNAIRSTLLFAVLACVTQNIAGLALALLLERDTLVNRIARSLFFIPVLMSALAVGYVFQALLRPDGALNQLLGTLAGQPVTIEWLGNTTWTIVIVALVNTWKWVGLAMLIYLAGLKTMPHDILEAARIDGASWWRTFVSVRLPLLAPAITFNVATGLLGSMNSFDVIQATTMGGPARTTEVMNIFIYRTFGQGLYSQATAMSLVLLLAVAILAFPLIAALRRRENVL
jgi:raffinose/stachyose/melibiose transport system permease protein